MISPATEQAHLAARATVRAIPLVRIRTFSNYEAGTVSSTFYWSTLPILYQWTAPAVVEFEPVIRSVSPVVRGFPHIPDGVTLATRDGISIVVDGLPRGDREAVQSTVYDRLNSTGQHAAMVDVASLLVDESAWSGVGWWDLSAMGSVHVVRWRGELTRVGDFDWEEGRFSVLCDTREPVLDWPTARDPDLNDPRDAGRRYPMPMGLARRVPLVNIEVGRATTLVADTSASSTGSIQVTDADGFPTSGSYTIQVDDELMTVNGAASSASSLSVTARGVAGTTAVVHRRGTTVLESVREARFALSAREIQSISALYWKGSAGELLRIPTGAWGWNPGNDLIEPGKRIGVVSFFDAALRETLSAARALVEQPTAAITEPDVIRIPFDSISFTASPPFAGVTKSDVSAIDPNGLTGSAQYGAPTISEVIEAWCETAPADADAARTVQRWRLVIDYLVGSNGAGTAARLRCTTAWAPGGDVTNQEFEAYSSVSPTRATAASTWRTPSSSVTVGDFIGAGPSSLEPTAFFWIGDGDNVADSCVIYCRTSYFEFEVDPPPVDVSATRVSGELGVGNGLELVADCRGGILRSSEAEVTSLPFNTTTGWSAVNCSISTISVDGRSGLQCFSPTGTLEVYMRFLGLSADWSAANAAIEFECYCNATDKGYLDDSGQRAIVMRLESAGGETLYSFGAADVIDGRWTKLVVDLNYHPRQEVIGSGVDLASVVNFRLGGKWTSAVSTPQLGFRNVRFVVRTMAQHAIDVGSYVIQELAGLAGSVDGTAYAAAKADLPSVNLAVDLRRCGESMPEILERIGFESRTNWIPAEGASGTVYKPLTPNSGVSYSWDAAVRTLTEFRKLLTDGRHLDELSTEFSALWGYRNDRDPNDVEAFSAIARADATVNDASAKVSTAAITTLRNSVGLRPSLPQAFIAIGSESILVEVWAYYVTVALQQEFRRFAMVVSYAEAWDLEPGDIVTFETPWDGDTVKARIVRVAFPFDSPGIGLTLEEVL